MAKKQSMTLEQALQVILAADGDNPLRQMLEWMVQQALELEMNGHLGALISDNHFNDYDICSGSHNMM